MIVRFFFCGLLMLIIIFDVKAQLEKGSWMVNGDLRQVNLSFNSVGTGGKIFNLRLAPELSYMVTKHLMLGGKLNMGIGGNQQQRITSVAQHLRVRHYFKQLDNFFLFYGGEIVFDKRTARNISGGSNNSKNRTAFLYGGWQMFLQESVAIDFLFNYEVVQVFTFSGSQFSRTEAKFGTLLLEGRLQFFIHKEKKGLVVNRDYRLYPGSWLIGGNFQIGNNDFIQPEVQRIWGSGWATGLRLDISYFGRSGSLGFTPLLRKYFRLAKKGKPWLEIGAGLEGSYRKTQNRQGEEWWTTTKRTFSMEGSVGWSNFISENFTFDFFITRSYGKENPVNIMFGTELIRNGYTAGFILSGLLTRKK